MAAMGSAAHAPQRIPIRLILFGLVAVVAVWVGFLAFDVNHARIYVKRYGYYTISLTFAWAVFAVWRIRAEARRELLAVSWRERWQIAAVIALCAGVAIATVPHNYKVLYDEAVLQATARQLHFFREISTIVRGYQVDGVFAPFDAYLDKRPYFFVYVVSLVHDLTGYREGNAFGLNMALMFVVLGQIYLLARRIASHAGAMAAVVAIGTLSLLAHNATGAGMEMLNLAMLLLVTHVAVFYLEAPTERLLSALILCVVLLAQTRYESSLYVAPVTLIALEGWRRARRVIMPPAAILAPALLIPYAVHNTYLSGTPLLWELGENATTRFSVQQVLPNLQHAWSYFFNVSPLMTNSWWLSAVGLLSLGFAAYELWRARKNWQSAPAVVGVLVCIGGAIVANLCLLMFYYWGQLDDPIVGRLSLPFFTLSAFAIAYTVSRFNAPRRRLGAIVAGGAVLAYLSSGLAANAQQTGLNTLEHELMWERRFVDALPPGYRLIITNKSALPWMLRDQPSILTAFARQRVDALKFHLAAGTFREVLVLQSFRPSSAEGEYQLDPNDRLPDSFVLEQIGEHRFGTRLLRISRLVEIRLDAPATNPAK
jgi:hypothetical protein